MLWLINHVFDEICFFLIILSKISFFVWIFLEARSFASLLLLEELSITYWT